MVRVHKFAVRTGIIAILFVLFTSLSGCLGITQPSDDDIKSMAEERFDQEYAGLFIASNVVKNNGYKQNDTNYVAELTITGTAQASIDEYAQNIMNDKSLSSIEKITSSMTIGLLKITMPEFKAGDQIEFKKNYLFIKTDNGWQLKKELKPEDQL